MLTDRVVQRAVNDDLLLHAPYELLFLFLLVRVLRFNMRGEMCVTTAHCLVYSMYIVESI